ncbi:MAG: MFS transporter, partial [Bacteroidales bacterium]
MNWKRQITAFLAGQTITLFGSMLVQFAITWYIARETSSGLYVTLSVLCSFGPQILLSIFSGVWADRYNKKMLIILSDGGIALATLILAILMARGASGIWLLFIFSAVRSAGSGIQMPAIQAILPQLVPKDKLMRINGITNSIHSTINLVSPAAAGAILSFGAFHYLLLIDVVTAAIGISILIGIPFLHKAKEKEAREHAGY